MPEPIEIIDPESRARILTELMRRAATAGDSKYEREVLDKISGIEVQIATVQERLVHLQTTTGDVIASLKSMEEIRGRLRTMEIEVEGSRKAKESRSEVWQRAFITSLMGIALSAIGMAIWFAITHAHP